MKNMNPEETLRIVNAIETMHQQGMSYEDAISELEAEAALELQL